MPKPNNLRDYSIIVLVLLLFGIGFSQDQRVADSLTRIYRADTYTGTDKMELLKELSFNEVNSHNLAIRYADELIALAKEADDSDYLHAGYLYKGSAHRLMGDMDAALSAYFQSLDAAIKAQSSEGEAKVYSVIADIYSTMGNSANAEEFYMKAIAMLRKANDSVSLAIALVNTGNHYNKFEKYDSALVYFGESDRISRKLNFLSGIAYNLGGMGMAYAAQGNDILAEANINEAISLLEPLKDYNGISSYLISMADIHSKQKNYVNALNYAQRSLDMAEQNGLKDQISDANKKLAEIYEQAGRPAESYPHYKKYIAYRDSITNLEIVQQLADQRTNYQVSQIQLEVDLLNEQKRTQRIVVIATIIALFLIGLLAFNLYRRNQFIQKTKKIIEQEQKRSDGLLLNILPKETAQELKEHGKVQAKKYDSVTVMFTDFKGFTHSSEHLSPEQLVENVDYYFSRFDAIIEKYGLEKIKTMGDSYMCAGGLHSSMEDHATKMIHAAFEIIDYVARVKKDKAKKRMRYEIRIGINTGAVVAGVVGTTKFAYDIWGDTVNVAARMESHSETGKVNISENTYALVKDLFDCEYRGVVKVKNRGKMKMYYVKGLKEKREEHSDMEAQAKHV